MAPKRLPAFVMSLACLMAVVVLSNLPVGHCKGPAQVTIISDTDDGEFIYAHCKSGNDDIGLKKLPYGQSMSWSFRMNIGLTTLYWCNFSWYSPAAKRTLFGHFVVWDIKVVSHSSNDVATWKVEKDGFYFYNDLLKLWELRYTWSINRTAVKLPN